MQVVRIKSSFFDAGQEVWVGGQDYPVTDASMRQVELGNGEVVNSEGGGVSDVKAAVDVVEPSSGQGQVAADPGPAKHGRGRRSQA